MIRIISRQAAARRAAGRPRRRHRGGPRDRRARPPRPRAIRVHKVLDPLAGPVTGDPGRLQQVVWNLLTNAVKFTPKGGRVQVLLERVNSHVEISVIDTGEGIEPEFLPHVFDRFRQADALDHAAARRAGARAGDRQATGRAARRAASGPRAPARARGRRSPSCCRSPSSTRAAGAADGPARAEPPPTRSTSARTWPSPASGCWSSTTSPTPASWSAASWPSARPEVAVAASAAEALDLLERPRPTCWSATSACPSRTATTSSAGSGAPIRRPGDLPAVALTAFARAEDRNRAMLAGFQTHVAKPVEPAELTAVVASLAGRTGKSDQHHGGHPCNVHRSAS